MTAGGLRVLVVGAGSIGRRHHDNLLALGARAELISWRGYSAEALTDRLRAGADAVVIATATDVRLPLIAACAGAGVPVYVFYAADGTQRELPQILTVDALTSL